MMNGFLEPTEDGAISFESSPQKDCKPCKWIDIQDIFAAWSSELARGELASIPNFSLYDAMSAIELMDAKMDIGLLLTDRKVSY